MPDPQLRIAKFALINSENNDDCEDIPTISSENNDDFEAIPTISSENNDDLEDIPTISSENNDDFEDIPTISSENNDDFEDIPTKKKLEQKDETGEDIPSGPSSSFTRRKLDQDIEMMRQMGLPTHLGKNIYYGPPSSSKSRSPEKQVESNVSFSTSEDNENNEVKEEKFELPTIEKKTYFCEICLIKLSSDATKKSHVEGKPHKRNMDKKRKKITETGKPLPEVIQIDNPEPKKKVPIRLKKKVKESQEPIVGLKYVTEYLAVSNIEMEPHYECNLCNNQGQANTILTHLKGAGHRENFLFAKFPYDPKYIDLTQVQLNELVSEYSENKLNISDLITTHKSDELYPWPESKEPWSIEAGGSGVAPENAIQNYGKSKAEKYDQCRNLSPERKKERDLSPIGYVASDLPNPISLKRPRSAKEASWFLESGTDMLKNVLEMDGLFNSKEAKILKANLTAVINSAAIDTKK